MVTVLVLMSCRSVEASTKNSTKKGVSQILASYEGKVYIGGKLDTDNLIVMAIYNDGSSKLISSGYTINSYKIKSGSNTLKLSYKGKTVSFKVTGVSKFSYVPLVKKNSITGMVGKKLNGINNLTVSPNASVLRTTKITWKSSRPSVATINSSGKISCKKQGSTYITARLLDTSLKFKINVVKPIKHLVIDSGDEFLYAGSTVALNVLKKPYDSKDTIRWKSSNSKIATVSSKGVVKALKPGKVTITARADSGKKANYKFKVYYKLKSLGFDKNTYSISKNNTLNLNSHLKLNPTKGAYAKLTWDTNNSFVATIDKNGNVKGLASGTAYISVTSSEGVWASCMVQVN